MEDEDSGQLFDGIVFTIIPDENLDARKTQEITDLLQQYGARLQSLRTEDELIEPLHEVTHIISIHIDFPQYSAALGHGINIVKPSWVIQSAAKGKQAQPRQHSPDPSQFFNNVILTTAGLPESDTDALIAGVIALGGQYSSQLSRLVTHIVTVDPNTNEKCRVAQEKRLHAKIVLPHWFDDCFRLGKKISERPYLFPDPEILQRDYNAKIRDNPSVHIEGATAARPTGLPPATPSSSPSDLRKNLNALQSKKVFLSADLQLSTHLRDTVKGLIQNCGGTLTEDVDDTDIYIGHHRDGDAYISASRAGKEVANLSWLYHVINRNKYTSPLSKLLHYPVPRKGMPGFEGLKISISNYQGDARIYLENLVKHCGAEYTRTMKEGNNTHLITAHLQSAKVDAAQEWGLHIVNHIWLEESYAKCAVQTLTNPRYQTFPARTNLGEVTGQTRFDMKKVERAYFTPARDSPRKQATVATSTNTISPKRTSFTSAHAATDVPNLVPRDETPKSARAASSRPLGRPSKTKTTPDTRDEEKENQSPAPAHGGRASKAKALGLLHQQADDIALYNKEVKRKGGVTHGGRRSENAEHMSSPAAPAKGRKKRTSDEATFDASAENSECSDGETEEVQPAKKAKHTTGVAELPPIRYRMMVSGDERWLDKSDKESTDRMKLRILGVQLVQDSKSVDILVAPKILRTRKFVSALAGAPLVVSTQYLDTALKQGKLVEKPKPLEDRDTEERLGFKLVDALDRSRANQRKLLRGWSIFVTKDIPGGFDTYKDFITLNGGVALLYQGRTGLTLPKRRLRDDPEAGSESLNQGDDDEFNFVYLVSGISDAEKKLWKTFREIAKKQNLQARIVKSDWLINAAMSQRVTWDSKWALDDPVNP